MGGYEDRNVTRRERRRVGGFGILMLVVLAAMLVLVVLAYLLDRAGSGVVETETVPLDPPAAEDETFD